MSEALLQVGDTFERGGTVFELVSISGQDDDKDGQSDFHYEFISKDDADKNRKRNEESAKAEKKAAADAEAKRAVLRELKVPDAIIEQIPPHKLDEAVRRTKAEKRQKKS